MSDSSLSSSDTSLSSSESLDCFSNLDKLKPYDFEPTVSDNENIEMEKSVLQICKQRTLKKKEQKGNLHWCLLGKYKAMSTNADSLCCREKNKVSDVSFNGNFLHF